MAELRVVGKYRGPGEQLTAETLAQQLPDDWVLIANRSLPTAEHDDVDLTVVGRNLIFAVEDKHWGPTVKVGPGAWVVKRQPRENPTDRISFLARKLAGLLRTRLRLAGYPRKGHVVKSFVVLSCPGVEVDWSEAGPESNMVVLLEEAAEALLEEDRQAPVSIGPAREQTIAFLDGWKQRYAVPDHLGSYAVHREIAPLGRARVFAARDDVGDFVFLRCYPMDGWGPRVDPNNLVRRERKAIQRLARSGRTLECQPVFEDDLHRWIVVPIVQQPLMNLPRLLSMASPPVDPATSDVSDVARFVADAFEGLQKIHDSGVVHRGIAPARVALDGDGNVKFTDFYLAQMTGEATVAPSLNEMADLGVPFRAPECRTFIGAALLASDVYSLALSLLWWLQGDPKARPNVDATPERADLVPVAALLRRCTASSHDDRPDIDAVVAGLTSMRTAAR